MVRIIWKIDARYQALEQASHKNANFQMRRLHAPVRSGYTPRRYRDDSKPSLIVGGNASVAFECGVDLLLLSVFRMSILSMSVRLPNFNHGIGHGNAVAIQYSSLDRDPFSRNPGPS
jgi:hypothetical protein